MSLHRHAARRDANHADCATALQQAGFHVRTLSGEGIPDLLTWHTGGPFILIEVKTVRPTSEGGSNPLTPAQALFMAESEGCPRVTVRNVGEAVLEAQRLHLAWSLRP